MKLYAVTMIRWTGEHTYVLGIYKLKHQALKAAKQEEIDRGGTKYYATVWEIKEFGKSIDSSKIIYGTSDLVANEVYKKFALDTGIRD